MPSPYDHIARVLGGARRRQVRLILATGGAAGAAGAAVAILLGILSLARGNGGAGTRVATLAAVALSLLAAAVWAAVAVLRRAATPDALVAEIGKAEPALRSDLLSAVELQRERDQLAAAGYSLALADAHIERTAVRAAAVDLRRALPSLAAKRAGLALASTVGAHLLALAIGGRAVAAGYGLLAGLGAHAAAPLSEPITGDVELSFSYPAHTGRPPRTISGTGGEISAPRGTEVRLSARADRVVESAELVVEAASTGAAPGAPAQPARAIALEVAESRKLSGRLVVGEPGSYHFRFKKGRRVLAEGPPIPIAVEPDAFPEVRITAPGPDVEVDAKARVRVDWTASDDYGLGELSLVTKAAGGSEQRRQLRSFEQVRRESGSFEIDLGPLRLDEGERLLYWLEITDNDAVGGPKRGASATQVVRVYSEAEHRRQMLERARELWEQMVRLLGDHLELVDRSGGRWTAELLAQGQALDERTGRLHVALRDGAAALRKERGGSRAVADALANTAAGLRNIETPLSAVRAATVRLLRAQAMGDPLWQRMGQYDAALDRELEKDILYLESLFDKERSQDLLRLAKDLQGRRRDLASMLEKYKEAPSEDARRQLLAEMNRMKQRMQEMMRRMSELAKGIQDEHMNAEALAELERQQEGLGGLDKMEEFLARGDVEGAMKELDALGSRMQKMLSSLERTAGAPDEKTRELMREMQEFEKRVRSVEREQEQLAGETEKLRQQYRRRIAEKLEKLGEQAGKLEKLAREARDELGKAKDGLTPRAEEEYAQARERLSDLQKALSAKDFEAARESLRPALPAMQRLAISLEDDAAMEERFPRSGQKPAPMLREAERHALQALQPAKKIRDELDRLFPDPRGVLPQAEQRRMEGMERRQGELEREANQLRQKLQELAEKAPVFPPESQAMLGEAQGHMGRARAELGQKDPQRGHGEQRQALDSLARFRKGLEEMAKNGGSKAGGSGFPMPFAMKGSGDGRDDGEAGDPSRDKVEIPGADAYKVPEEFRKDILEAMRQGAPEPYKPELQRYYEELVK